jgi:biotin carboxyl carrier protein
MKKFLIKVNGNEYEVEVEEVREDGFAAQPAFETRAAAPAPAVQEAPAAPAVAAPKAPAPKQEAPKKDTAVPSGAQVIKAPMPGTILKVSVNTGDTVKRGQVLLVLEAMKMENEIVAPVEGKVSSVNVSKGASVNAGDVLVSLS